LSSSVSSPRLSPFAGLAKAGTLCAVALVAVWYVATRVLHYYLNYSAEGLDYFWPYRGWLLLHISGGTVALLIGPWQFSQRLRQRHLTLHRLSGRVYLVAIACAASASFYLAVRAPDGWAWGAGLAGLGFAWLMTSGMAYYAVRQRQIQIHREWMVRSYIVTFAFVTDRVLAMLGRAVHLIPLNDSRVTFIWACWSIPLLIAEMVMQLNRMRRQKSAIAK
jgi:uncharacterized membrane protein